MRAFRHQQLCGNCLFAGLADASPAENVRSLPVVTEMKPTNTHAKLEPDPTAWTSHTEPQCRLCAQ